MTGDVQSVRFLINRLLVSINIYTMGQNLYLILKITIGAYHFIHFLIYFTDINFYNDKKLFFNNTIGKAYVS